MSPPVQFVEANGVRFAYLEEGRGPLVLLVHGFPDTAHSFDATRPALARAGFRAVSPFTRGYHPTAVPADRRYDSETLGRDLLALIPALGAEQAVIVGHDWGAAAAYAAAALQPERLRQLITVGIPFPGSLLPGPRLLWGVRHFLRFQFPDAADKVRRDDFRHVDELLRRWSPAWDPPASESAAVKECFRHPESLDAALGYYRALRPWAPAALRRRIRVPAVVFAGDQDGVLRPEDYEPGRRFFPAGYDIVRMPGGHFMHREHPQRFNDELLRVLQR